MSYLTRYWYQSSLHWTSYLLLPFSWLFRLIVFLRCLCYQKGLFKIYHADVPVIVVGNITVGGTGKTPFVIWLANALAEQGYKPGIVSRGVGGKKHRLPYLVSETDRPELVGDEALVIIRNTKAPLVICVNRVAAVSSLKNCNIIISDDGLQHYRMGRTLEIALIDVMRGLGNQQLLPAGPLREPPARLKSVDCVITNGNTMSFDAGELVSVIDEKNIVPLQQFKYSKFHAVAAVGNPARFFANLKTAGFTLVEHTFPDHYLYQSSDLHFKDDLPIIMTEKDAVKCKAFADERYWYLRVRTLMPLKFIDSILQLLEAKDAKHAINSNSPDLLDDVGGGRGSH